MSPKPRAPSRPLQPALVRASLLCASLLALAAFGSMACEDNGIGRRCDLQADAGQQQAVYNSQALACPSRICLKPLVPEGSPNVDTGPYCSALCSQDSDCAGRTRDQQDTNDKGCVSGYTCGEAFVVGPLCCEKLCLCKDFLTCNKKENPNCIAALQTPLTCVKDPTTHKNGCQETP
jgi:hypothetical protein